MNWDFILIRDFSVQFAHPLKSKKIPNRWIAGNCSQLQEEKERDRPGGNKAI